LFRFQLTLVFVLLVTFLGCSSHQSPVTPDTITSLQSINPSNRTIWGYWNIKIDPLTETVNIIPDRDVAMHFNVVRLLEVDPCSDCLTIKNLEFLSGNILECDFQLRHPFPGILKLTGFDVHGVLVTDGDTLFPVGNRLVSLDSSNLRLIDPDGYTPLFNPVEFPADSAPWPILGYIPGKLASGDDFDGTLNPFMAFSKDNPRRMFEAGSTETVTINLRYPSAPFEFGYIVDASWVKVDAVVDPVTDFPPEANCLEPYKLNFQMLSNIISYPGDTAEIQIEVFDHQGLDTISTVSIECQDIFDDEVSLNYSSASGDDSWFFDGTITNDEGAAPGNYPALLKAVSSETDANLGELAAYQIVSIEVLPAPASDGQLIWARRAGGKHWDEGYAITTLSDDSTVVAGSFQDSATFGEGEPNETVLESDGYFDIFVAHYNPYGTLEWAKQAGGTNDDGAWGITTLSDDSTVVTGYFQDSVTFGKGEANETVMVSAASYDIFMARYNPDGTLAWAKRAGGTNWDWAQAITTLSDESAVVTGAFGGAATFGPGETNETVLVSAASYDIFIARYNSDGTLAWAKSAGGTSGDKAVGITTLLDDSTVITGYFQGDAVFGAGEPNETILVADYGNVLFVARYNPDGTLAWAKRAGGEANYKMGLGITALSDNSTVVTGYFGGYYGGPIIFGEGEPNETVLVSELMFDIFVARYNPDGTLEWATQAGGIYAGMSYGITALLDNSSVVTGYFNGAATFGEGEPNETTLISVGDGDIFVARYNPDGTLTWVKSADGTSVGTHGDCGNGITTLSDNSTVVTGRIWGPVTFGPGEPNETVLVSHGSGDIFIARYAP